MLNSRYTHPNLLRLNCLIDVLYTVVVIPESLGLPEKIGSWMILWLWSQPAALKVLGSIPAWLALVFQNILSSAETRLPFDCVWQKQKPSLSNVVTSNGLLNTIDIREIKLAADQMSCDFSEYVQTHNYARSPDLYAFNIVQKGVAPDSPLFGCRKSLVTVWRLLF